MSEEWYQIHLMYLRQCTFVDGFWIRPDIMNEFNFHRDITKGEHLIWIRKLEFDYPFNKSDEFKFNLMFYDELHQLSEPEII